ncbi:hypothetical protein KAR04_00275 [Candidatus Calescamantes bacterium]|jgi:hypothetical protein|nr:hypothetical protein [Candidatus Calescamantes bacterium]MCK5670044.1 hypothetical protein [Candidatus Bathyarchaeota archaeon]
MTPTLNDALDLGYSIDRQSVYDDNKGELVMSWALYRHDELLFISPDIHNCLDHLTGLLLEVQHD